MADAVKIFILIFSIFRISSLLASEEGPYLPFLYKDPDQSGIFEWIRKKAGAYDYIYAYDERGHQEVKIKSNLGRGISCPLCVGGYVAFVLVVLYFLDNIIINFFLLWLGVWGVQVFLINLTSDDAIASAIEDAADSMEDK